MVPSNFENEPDSDVTTDVALERESKSTEIDIETIEGQQQFLEAAEDVFSDAMVCEAAAITDNYSKLNDLNIDGKALFEQLNNSITELQEIVDRCCQELIPNEEYISDEEFEKMQNLYNQMLESRNTITAAYEDFVIQSTPVAPESGFETEPAPVYEAIVPVEKVPTPEVIVPENTDEKSFELLLGVVSGDVKKALDFTTRVKVELKKLFPDSIQTEDVKICLTELDTILQRINIVDTKLVDFEMDTSDKLVAKITLEKYQRIADEVTKNAEFVREVLVKKSSDSKQIAKPEVSGATPIPVPEKVVTKVSTTNLEQRRIPSEVEVLTLIKKVSRNQFYTKTERQMVALLREKYELAKADDSTDAVVVDRYQELKEVIDSLDSRPEIEELLKRTESIVRHLIIGFKDKTNLLDLAKTMQAKLNLLAGELKKDKEQILNTYRNLERLAINNESHWQMVCGLSVPAAGPAGIPAAHAMRERLTIERDKHPELRNDPLKKVLVDKLIRKLANIPKTGLSTEVDLPEIVQLMRMIDVMEATSAAAEHTLNEKKSVAVSSETDEESLPYGEIHHRKTMDIESDTNDEGNVAITVVAKQVAREAEERISNSVSVQEVEEITETAPVKEIEPMVVTDDIPMAEKSALGAIEKNDVINHVIPRNVSEIRERKSAFNQNSLTNKYLKDEHYQKFIAEYIGSTDDFERGLQAIIAKNDNQSIDAFERFLGEIKASPFEFLKDLTIQEVDNLLAFPGKELRSILAVENIKYEAFNVWMDEMDKIRQEFDADPDMSFGEFFARGVIENEIYYSEVEA